MGKEEQRRGISRRDLLIVAGASFLSTGFGGTESFPNPHEVYRYIADDLPKQHLAPAISVEKFHRPAQVKRTIDFILSHQLPNGAFLTDFSTREIVPMDIGHAALGLTKAGYLNEAKAGVSWALSQLTPPGEGLQKINVNGKQELFDYSGSWYNEYDEHGKPKLHTERGRAEQDGLVFNTINAICLEDPAFFTQSVDGVSVANHVWNMTLYLERVQQPDGRFIHRPDYQKVFPEENVRMAEGLRLMAEQFIKIGEVKKAEKASEMSKKAFAALDAGKGFTYGMSYDFLARGMWGVGGRTVATKDIMQAITAGKMTATGVRMYDMKQDRISYLDREQWKQKWGGELFEVAGSIDGAIALLMAGLITDAERYEKEISSMQKADGGFPTAFLGPFNGGRETIFAAGRYLLLERLITEVVLEKNQKFVAS